MLRLMLLVVLCFASTALATEGLEEAKNGLRAELLASGLSAVESQLSNPDPLFSRAATQVLTETFLNARRRKQVPTYSPLATSSLARLAGSEDPSTRADAIRAIGYSGTSEPNLHLILRNSLRDSQPEVVKRSALALGRLKSKAAAADLEEVLQHKGWLFGEARAAAATALGAIRAPSSVQPLIAALGQDSFWQTRKEAARALGKFRARSAVNTLVQQLSYRRHWQVRYYSAIALGKIGDKRAIPSLKKMYKRETLEVRICGTANTNCRKLPVRRAASWALKQISQVRIAKTFAEQNLTISKHA